MLHSRIKSVWGSSCRGTLQHQYGDALLASVRRAAGGRSSDRDAVPRHRCAGHRNHDALLRASTLPSQCRVHRGRQCAVGRAKRRVPGIAALSYPIGYPYRFRETLIVDVYTRESDLRGQRNNTGIEIGLRHQVSSRVVADAGIGTEIYGPSDRAAMTGTIGLSVGF